jgi:hypothetical protein
MDSEFRELTVRERGLLEKLLTAAIHGGEELRTQLAHCKVKQIETDGTLDLQCQGGAPALGKYAPVAEAAYKDADGADIALLLHLGKGGFMSMLEIIKYNGSPIIRPPSAQDLVLLMPESPGEKASENADNAR